MPYEIPTANMNIMSPKTCKNRQRTFPNTCLKKILNVFNIMHYKNPNKKNERKNLE